MSSSPNEPPEVASLLMLETWGRGRVVRVHGEGPAAERLRELGFTPGTDVEFVRRAPLGDPLCFRLRGTELCLRRAEAGNVEIERA